MKRILPKDVKEGSCTKTPIDWILSSALCEQHTYESFLAVRAKFGDVIHSAPITNTWPERSAMALERIKTKFRNRLSQIRLNAQLQVSINGPEPGTQKAFQVITKKTFTP